MSDSNFSSIQKTPIDQSIRILTPIFASSSTPRLDAQVLISHVIKKPRAWLLAHKEEALTPTQQISLNKAAARIQSGVPLPYVIGQWAFFNLDFHVTPAVLIPRPETEGLVERAIEWLLDNPTRRRCLDIGTGSGCIAISLAHHIDDLEVTAVDISKEAITVAQNNAAKHKVADRISFVNTDFFSSNMEDDDWFTPRFDVIIANLPYIPTATLKTLAVGKNEPGLALDGGKDGLDLIRKLITSAHLFLIQGGCIFLEIGADQGQNGVKYASDHFPKARVNLYPDLSGKDRFITIAT